MRPKDTQYASTKSLGWYYEELDEDCTEYQEYDLRYVVSNDEEEMNFYCSTQQEAIWLSEKLDTPPNP